MKQPTEQNAVYLTNKEKTDLINILYFYESCLLLDLTGEETEQLKTIIKKLEQTSPEYS